MGQKEAKIAVVTGASGGIGIACVRKLRQEGFKVLAHYNRGVEKARLLDAEKIYKADFMKPLEVEKMCAEILSEYKRADLLVNAAGMSESGLFTELSDAHMREILEINLLAAMTITRAFLPAMISDRSGAIVNISSIWGIAGASCETAYSTAKAGIIGFTKSLAREVGPSNVRVNCIAPGVIDTAMNNALSQETKKELIDKTPLNRLGRAEEIAEAVAFFAKAEFVTGQVLTVDGGFI